MRVRGTQPPTRIARRTIESGKHLGCYCWIVERATVWLARFRRLTIRYEPRPDLHLATPMLTSALICRVQLKRCRPCVLSCPVLPRRDVGPIDSPAFKLGTIESHISACEQGVGIMSV